MDSPISGFNLLRMTFPIPKMAGHLRDGTIHLEMAESSWGMEKSSQDGEGHPQMARTIPEMGGHLRDGKSHLRDGRSISGIGKSI